MFVIVDSKAGQRAGDRVWFSRRASIVLALYATAGGARALAGEVADDLADEVRDAIRLHPHYREAKDGELVSVATGAPPPPTPDPAPATPTVEALRSLAMRLGWSVADLGGTGLARVRGEAGGRSPVSGLTLSEMTMSSPPRTWFDTRETVYPWELSDWRPPGPGWVPPSAPSKRPTVVEEVTPTPTDEADPEDATLEDEETPAETEPVEPNPMTREAGGSLVGGLLADGPALLVGAGYPAEHASAAFVAADELYRLRGGNLNHQALNYALRKLNLPTVSTAQLSAIVPPAPTT